jgi:flagellar basal-body rod protein FlgF
MADGIWTAMGGAMARQSRLDRVAQDLANANTVGYRRHALTFREHLADTTHPVTAQAPLDMPLRVVPNDNSMVVREELLVREEAGALQHTGHTFDFALAGRKGYFVVQSAEGEEQLTRDGRFKLGDDRTLQTRDGAQVLGPNGPINIPQGEGALVVTKAGDVHFGDALIGRLRVGYASPKDLRHIGANRFEADAIEPLEEAEISQGYVESSTVSAVGSMVELISTHRAFEANMKLISTYKDLDETANRLNR